MIRHFSLVYFQNFNISKKERLLWLINVYYEQVMLKEVGIYDNTYIKQ